MTHKGLHVIKPQHSQSTTKQNFTLVSCADSEGRVLGVLWL